MKAIILAGGMGTRLREETVVKPKPMVEIDGRPILWHIMKGLSFYGINDFIIATGYKSELIKDYFLHFDSRNCDFTVRTGSEKSLVFHGNAAQDAWNVTVTDTGIHTLTAGRILQASKYLDNEPFLVTYGDGLSDVNIDELQSFHFNSGLLATVTVVQPKSRFGVLDVAENGQVLNFLEKSKIDGWINAGFFIFQPEVLEYLRTNEALEDSTMTNLVKDSQLAAFRHLGFWQPMDTSREMELLEALCASGKPPWKTW
jgi:glucose-1-phosphate cytidylyltransferase